ncbi:plasmid replication protein, CyRepA1 family [Chromobacterium paludis]|nr:plasmid replication protein, CyRepA1 family [Chromobacterium paludis]
MTTPSLVQTSNQPVDGLTLYFSCNPQLIGKPDLSDDAVKQYLARGFINRETRFAELIAFIESGYAITGQFSGRRSREYFQQTNVVMADFDDGLAYDALLAMPLIRQYAAAIYATPSHTEAKPRWRVVFVLDEVIVDADKLRSLMCGILLELPQADPSCRDTARMFFGAKAGTSAWVLGNVLPANEVARLCALPSLPSQGEQAQGTMIRSGTGRRGEQTIDPDMPIQLANGHTGYLAELDHHTAVHCPFHADKHPSAFVTVSKTGGKGIYCSSCDASFWPKRVHAVEHYDFSEYVNSLSERQYWEEGQVADAQLAGIPNSLLYQPTRTYHERWLGPIEDAPGISLLISGKGTGKTEQLTQLVRKLRARGQRVLVIGHRQVLVSALAARLGLHCYLDDDEEGYDESVAGYAICLDSLPKRLSPALPKVIPNFDVVIIDEAEQVWAHLFGDTIKSIGRVWGLLSHFLKKAKTVIAADADLSEITEDLLMAVRGWQEVPNVYYNSYAGEGRAVQLFAKQDELEQDLMDALQAGQRLFVATNSAKQAEALANVMTESGKRCFLVTSHNSGQAAVRKQLNDLANAILDYDVMVASPSVGTGFDITFPMNEALIDCVYGIFVGGVTTHFDIDQQLGRVRNPKAVKVWINPRREMRLVDPLKIFDGAYRLESEYIKDMESMCHGFDENYRPRVDPLLLWLLANVNAKRNASLNNLRANFIEYKKAQGWMVELIGFEDDEDRPKSQAAIRLMDARKEMEEARVQAIVQAKTLDKEAVDQLNITKQRRSLSPHEQVALTRYYIELFYEEPISQELVELDDDGRHRERIRLLANVLMSEDLARFHDQRKSDRMPSNSLVLRRELMHELLERAHIQVTEDGLICQGELMHARLSDFAAYCQFHAVRVETLLKIPVNKNVLAKPMSQLNRLLGLMAISTQRIGQKDQNGKRVYLYTLNDERMQQSITYAKRYLARNALDGFSLDERGHVQLDQLAARFKWKK